MDTSGFVGSRNFDDTVFMTNLEAAQTIARQLRLCNLGGIVIDLIDIGSEEHRNAVLAEFNKALTRDHACMPVNGFNALRLVEMTRLLVRSARQPLGDAIDLVLAQPLQEVCQVPEGLDAIQFGGLDVVDRRRGATAPTDIQVNSTLLWRFE